MSLARKAAIFLICAALSLQAAPKLTTIQDSIYKADGTRFNGTAIISWTPFDASDSSKIGLVAFARICEISAVGELITDHAASPQTLSALADAGVRITTV